MATAVVAAAVDWFAVASRRKRVEFVAKPAVLTLLLVAAVALPAAHTDLASRRWWFVGALALSLAGDVLLMLPSDRFIAGLIAFLGGHVLYIVGLLQPPSGVPPFTFSAEGLVLAGVVVAGVATLPTTAILRSLHHRGENALIGPVIVYLVTLATMVVLATNVGVPTAAAGAILFLLSDAILAINRFVRPLPAGDLAVHVTYHVAQGLLVLSLVH